MTMRTFRYFVCANGHRGEEKTTENDQPYSKMWESITTVGLIKKPNDAKGYTTYTCEACGLAMTPSEKTQ